MFCLLSDKKRFLFSVWVVGLLTLTVACKDGQKGESGGAAVLSLEESQDKLLSCYDVVSHVDTVELQTGNTPMSMVLDACRTDSTLYVLDDAHALWSFRYPSGELVRRVLNRGHGYGEYGAPRTMTAGDDGMLYLLDAGQRKVLAFDRNLDYQSAFQIDFLALDLVKVADGFLFFNLLPTDDLKSIVYTDESGVIKSSFLPLDMQFDFLTGSKIFVRDSQGEVFFNPPFSNDIYRWTGNEPELAFHTDYGSWGHQGEAKASSEIGLSDDVSNSMFLMPEDYFMVNYYVERMPHFAFYNIETEDLTECKVDTTACIPFFPRWQYKGDMFGIFLTDDLRKWKPQSDSCGAVLFHYHLK